MSLKEMSSLLGLFPEGAEVRHNCLFIAGCDTVELAEKYGTPLYVFDELTLRHRCAEFKGEFSRRWRRAGYCWQYRVRAGCAGRENEGRRRVLIAATV